MSSSSTQPKGGGATELGLIKDDLNESFRSVRSVSLRAESRPDWIFHFQEQSPCNVSGTSLKQHCQSGLSASIFRYRHSPALQGVNRERNGDRILEGKTKNPLLRRLAVSLSRYFQLPIENPTVSWEDLSACNNILCSRTSKKEKRKRWPASGRHQLGGDVEPWTAGNSPNVPPLA